MGTHQERHAAKDNHGIQTESRETHRETGATDRMSEPAIQISMDEPGARALMAQLHRANEQLGKPIRDAIQWAGYYVSRSLGARTKVAPRLRPVVRPFIGAKRDNRYKTDVRRAAWGVPVYRNGKRVFRPIGRTGYQAKIGDVIHDVVIRFRDKQTAEYAAGKDRRGRRWYTLGVGAPDPADPTRTVPGIMSDRRRRIGRRGLAKRNWSVIGKMVPRGGTGSSMGVNGVGMVKWGGSKFDPVLSIRNDLRYAQDALKGGSAAIDDAMGAASRSLENRITKAIDKKMGAR